jgi:hypothetical protein
VINVSDNDLVCSKSIIEFFIDNLSMMSVYFTKSSSRPFITIQRNENQNKIFSFLEAVAEDACKRNKI